MKDDWHRRHKAQKHLKAEGIRERRQTEDTPISEDEGQRKTSNIPVYQPKKDEVSEWLASRRQKEGTTISNDKKKDPADTHVSQSSDGALMYDGPDRRRHPEILDKRDKKTGKEWDLKAAASKESLDSECIAMSRKDASSKDQMTNRIGARSSDIPMCGNLSRYTFENRDDADTEKQAQKNLDGKATAILDKVRIILHENDLYYYTGRTYRLLRDSDDLLQLVRSKVSSDAFGVSSIRCFSDLMSYMKADTGLIPANYEKRLRKASHLVVFRNGILDLDSFELIKHSPKYLTFYELDANWTTNPNPTCFLRFLRTASGGDKKIERRIAEVTGYLLTPINEGKCFFAMGTAPNSGKSTLGNLLLSLIGREYAASRATYDLSKRFSLGDINGKLLNLSMDLPEGRLNRVTVSIIKQITGDDTVMTEQKFQKVREVHSNMRSLFASNHPISVSAEENDDAFWDRMVVIPFLHSLSAEDRDSELLMKLNKEKNDIISYCLSAFKPVLERKCRFSECLEAAALKEQWRNAGEGGTQSVCEFIEECLEITGHENDEIPVKVLHQKYEDYCLSKGQKVISRNKMIRLVDRYADPCKRKRVHRTGINPVSCYIGMRWKDERAGADVEWN